MDTGNQSPGAVGRDSLDPVCGAHFRVHANQRIFVTQNPIVQQRIYDTEDKETALGGFILIRSRNPIRTLIVLFINNYLDGPTTNSFVLKVVS